MKIVKGQPFPLGVTRSEGRINFAVQVPEGKRAKLLLYTETRKSPAAEVEMEASIGEVSCVALADMDSSLLFYNYQIDYEIVVDQYVKSLSGKQKWGESGNVKKHEVCGDIFTEEYDWEEDEPLKIPYEDVIAYSLHIRGFTKDQYSDVSAKGTFEGVIEKIPYFLELGINQVQCMPVYEFEECKDPVNYWGYGPAYYFAPKNAYSSDGSGVRSLKDMVKALHKAGIEVVLEMPFDKTTPKQLMIDCLRYYVVEYHVDGFVCNHMVAPVDVFWSDPYLKKTKIMIHQTDFKDAMRRFLKGDEGQIQAFVYWLRHLSEKDRIFNYMTSHSGFTMNDLVSYNEKHNEVNGEHNRDGVDQNNSWNCGTEGPTQYDDIVALRKRQIRNAFFLLLLSQGTPCILAGDEWGNTQFGNNNVYCQDNEFGWLNWERFPYHHDLFEFVKEVIRLRKIYKVFHPKKEFDGKDLNNCGIPDVSYHGKEAWRADFSENSRQMGVYYHHQAEGEEVYVAYNMHWEESVFALPKLAANKKWYMIASTEKGIISEKIVLAEQQWQEIPPRSIVVFAGKV